MSRYLTKLCDQLVCLLSTEHSQEIVWGYEFGGLDDAVRGPENDDSHTKNSEQEVNAIARQGFTVCYLRTRNFPPY